jgi:hypothetical protein
MRLPLIKGIVGIIDNLDEDWANETEEFLLELTMLEKGLKDEELEVIGELVSNISGALEVIQMEKDGMSRKDALNTFMKRVVGSIDQ